MKRFCTALLFSCILFCGISPLRASEGFLFSYTTGAHDDKGGLHLAWSADGFAFEPVADGHSFLKCDFGSWGNEKKLIFPFIMRDKEGYWHCLWGLGWNYPRIAHSRSKDLFHWERHHYVPVMEKLNGKNCLSPEMVYDDENERFLLFWTSEVAPAGPRVYCTTTRDFSEYEPARLFYDPGHDVLDPTIEVIDGKYHLFYRRTTGDKKTNMLSIAVADKAAGPYEHLRDHAFEMDVIAPTLLKRADGHYVVFMESVTNKCYEAVQTKDFIHWDNVTDKIAFPRDARNGTVVKATSATVDFLQKKVETARQRHRDEVSFERPLKAEDVETPVTAKLVVDAARSKKISEELIGVFFEDINYSADGGLYAELVQNRGFEYGPAIRPEWQGLSCWDLVQTNDAEASVEIKTENPLHENNPHYAVVTVTKTGGKGVSLVNEGFDGIPLKKDDLYDFSVFARSSADHAMKIKARLIDKDGRSLGETETIDVSGDWKKYETTIKALTDCTEARLAVDIESVGRLDVDMVSLFPRKTFKNRKNGLRADLAQAIADLEPKFVRFPGGCLVHGQGLGNIYHWKRTVGPLEQRVPQRNIWGYHQSAGLGYFEYFQFCEDIGAEPVPVVAAGMCCQNSHRTGAIGIPMEEMPDYVRDVLDLIEYANGDASTEWGGKRAEAGRPEPFNLKYLGIGNEDIISDAFEERFTMIYRAVKEKHPEIVVIGTTGPFFEGTDYDEGWKLARKLNLPLVDEHYYVHPGWMIANRDFYDKYERNGTKVYLGEYASRGNTLYNALAEAAYLTGIERNADVVHMTSYAPLLAKDRRTQWKPDLIFFDNVEVRPTPNYYVQQLFGRNSGGEYVDNTLSVASDRTQIRKRLSASVVKDRASGDLVVKLVNILPVDVKTEIVLENVRNIGKTSKMLLLTENPAGPRGVPVSSEIPVAERFSIALPGHSLAVFRITGSTLKSSTGSTDGSSGTATADTVRQRIEPFRLEQVRLQPGPFKKAQDKDAAYLLSVEPDRLLAKFRINAGLEPKAEHYGGWEMKTIAGHSLGHYLSAVSFMYASTGDARFKDRADYIVAELDACQKAGKDGLVSAIEGVREKFDEVSKGEIRTHGFDLNGLWVPWYAQHKVYAGLLDAYRCCENEKALDIAKKLGDWGIAITKNLSDEQFQSMLRCEFGGMNESYYDLHALTGEEKYLKMGDRFYHHAILDPLREGRDELRRKHANTQIPKLVGLARRYEIRTGDDGDPLSARKTVEYFWDRVVNHHSYVTGSNSMGEHFGEPDKLNDRLRDDTAETCNTYNMLKLSKMLYAWTGDRKYMDYFERALFNHILPSIDLSDDPDKLFTYFVPLRSGGFRTYSSPNRKHEEQNHHWSCCHGTGMENHALYNGMIYYHGTEDGKDVLYVNLLIPSTLDWKEKGVRVTVADDCNIHVDADESLDLVVKVRAPNNSGDEKSNNNYYAAGSRWKKGETAIRLPFIARWKTESMPDNENRIAFFRGPWLYAADLGPADKPIADSFDEPSRDKIQIPVIVTDSRGAAGMIREVTQGKKCPCCTERTEYSLEPAVPASVPMIPFYEASRRYAVYFDLFDKTQWAEKQAEYKAERERLARIEALAVDRFQPGEMQPERDHDFKGENSFRGEHRGRKWRDAHDGGFMEFDMNIDAEKPCRLVLTYWGDDAGNREFDILVDGKIIASQKLERNAPGKFFDVSHDIDNPDKKDKIRVRLQAKSGKIAGGLFGAKTIVKE